MKPALVTVEKAEWPLERYGQIAIEDHCEDGTWSGAAASGNSAGANLAWQDPIDVMIRLPGEIVVTREILLDAFAKGLGVEDAAGWSTGRDILKALGL